MAKRKSIAGFSLPPGAITPLLYGGLAFAAYKFVLEPVMEKFGMIKSAAETANDAGETTILGWNPTFWQEALKQKMVAKADLLTTTDALAISKLIYAAMNPISTIFFDPEKLKAPLKRILSQVQLSQVTWFYNRDFKKDLFTNLNSKLTEDNMTKISAWAKGIPKYK